MKNKKLFLLLLIPIIVFFIGRSFSLPDDEEEEEPELDNWEISTVFYDSTVDNGLTPLTEINWDASNISAQGISEKTITVQITYRNTNAVQDYQPGELNIVIPNINYNLSNIKMTSLTTTVSANYGTNTGYEWNTNNLSTEYIIFTNKYLIEKNTNFEGTIQIAYSLRSNSLNATLFETEATYQTNKNIKAVLNDEIYGNDLPFNYKRTYTFVWEKIIYNSYIYGSKINSYDRLGNNPEDYNWVKFYLSTSSNKNKYFDFHSVYPDIVVNDFYYKIPICENCVAYDDSGNKYTINNGYLIIPDEKTNAPVMYSSMIHTYFYIGYPKDEYQDLNENIEINVDMYGTYENEEVESYLNSTSTNLKLKDYVYNYTGDLYTIEKTANAAQTLDYFYDTSTDLIYQSVRDNSGNNYIIWNNKINTRYTGEKYSIVLGDDAIFYTNNDEITKLDDNYYYFEYINIPGLSNSNSYYIEKDKYNIKLYVRYRGENEYIEYASFGNQDKKFIFENNEIVVGWYIIIEDLDEGINYLTVKSKMFFTKTDVEESGSLYNYSYLKVLDTDGNSLNTPSNYDSFVAKSYLINNDNSNHGGLLQRAECLQNWSMYIPYLGIRTSSVRKERKDQIMQDGENEEFSGKYSLSANFHYWKTDYNLPREQLITDFYDESAFFTNYHVYDLLPSGMKLDSSEEEIISSITASSQYFRDQTGEKAFSSYEEAVEFFKNHATVEIKENWNDTGRTWIHVAFNFPDKPLFQALYPLTTNSTAVPNESSSVYFTIKYKMSYESLMEYGYKVINYMYGYTTHTVNDGGSHDNGKYDIEAIDINENGSTDDVITASSYVITFSNVTSTHQDVQTTVQTDKSNYNYGKIETSKNSNYTYKLRVRTGQNTITNLVIYDSLDGLTKNVDKEYINPAGNNNSWHGEFLGVDTSYAESKGYNVIVYYNENNQPGSLHEDDTWIEYTDDTDKTKVKTLAFEYYDDEGNKATLPANTLTYVLINMKSPDEDYKTFSYNGCWTEWNAIDSTTNRPVDFITGINSNVVRLSLPNSVEPEDISITINKEWNDNNNSLGIRPNSANIHIINNIDGKNVQDEIISSENNWSKEVTVPKYDADGETIEFSLDEDQIELANNYVYIPTVNGLTVTNTLYKRITLIKNWIDNTNAYNTRPTSVTYVLKQNGNHYKDITFAGNYNENTWSTNEIVPVFDDDGNPYSYTLEEISILGYESSCSEFECTNLLKADDEIVITKEWNDKDNIYNTRPSNINITLKQNNEVYQIIQLSGETSVWTSNAISVPRYDDNGVKYTYAIDENQIDEYGIVSIDQATFKITNTLKKNISLTIVKNWVDDSNSDNTRPEKIEVILLRDNIPYKIVELSGMDNTWTTEIEVPKYDENQREYKYKILEGDGDYKNIYTDITINDDEYSITNKLSVNTNLTITKIWEDENNKFLTRPNKVQVNLYQNGVIYKNIYMKSNDSNIWTSDVNDIPKYDDNGKKYVYTIKEDTVSERYNKMVYDQSNFTIINELTDKPKVSLYFTVKNGYTSSGSNDIQYDSEGLNKILEKYKINGDDPYEYDFKLENVDTGEIVTGKLSTQGNLKFEDISYGTYRATEEKDKYFVYVLMNEIEAVNGVTFKEDEDGGTITITPTGKDILYGVNIVNKIEYEPSTPITSANRNFILIYLLLIVSIFIGLYVYKKKA